MAAVHLANAVGGNLFLGFISAVAFATILAVVAGLTLAGASAVSHDLYANVFRKGATEREELKVSKITVLVLGVIAIILGVLFENQNIAFMVGLAFAIAASCNFPHHSAFHVLVKTDHARRYAGRLVRFTDSGGADDSWPYHLGADPRPRKKRSSRMSIRRCSLSVWRSWGSGFSRPPITRQKATVNVSSSALSLSAPKRDSA